MQAYLPIDVYESGGKLSWHLVAPNGLPLCVAGATVRVLGRSEDYGGFQVVPGTRNLKFYERKSWSEAEALGTRLCERCRRRYRGMP